MARLIADENIQSFLVGALRKDGHDVLYIAEYADGITDEEVLSIASDQQRLLLTEDKDFGELVFRLTAIPGGLITPLVEGISYSHFRNLFITPRNLFLYKLKVSDMLAGCPRKHHFPRRPLFESMSAPMH